MHSHVTFAIATFVAAIALALAAGVPNPPPETGGTTSAVGRSVPLNPNSEIQPDKSAGDSSPDDLKADGFFWGGGWGWGGWGGWGRGWGWGYPYYGGYYGGGYRPWGGYGGWGWGR